jgi:uncharacterized membrane protein YeaQ/YmgE (transglycosylase-associated protein family)
VVVDTVFMGVVIGMATGAVAQGINRQPTQLPLLAGVGLAGALIGAWLASSLGLPQLVVLHAAGQNLRLGWSLIGAVGYVAIAAVLLRSRR